MPFQRFLLERQPRDAAPAFVQPRFPNARMGIFAEGIPAWAFPLSIQPGSGTRDECRKGVTMFIPFRQKGHLFPVRRGGAADEPRRRAGSGCRGMGVGVRQIHRCLMGQRWRVRRFNNIKTLLCQAHGGGARFHFIMDDVGDARVMQGSHFRTELARAITVMSALAPLICM